jgi:hypothetical protein
MGGVLFPRWQVGLRDGVPAPFSLVMGRDIICTADAEAKKQLAGCTHCPNCPGICIRKGAGQGTRG